MSSLLRTTFAFPWSLFEGFPSTDEEWDNDRLDEEDEGVVEEDPFDENWDEDEENEHDPSSKDLDEDEESLDAEDDDLYEDFEDEK